MFSIIIPTLNEERFLPLLLDSLVAQPQKNFEVIVVDGKSKDKTIEVAHQYDDLLPSLTVIDGDRRGVSAQRNKGAKNAKGQWYIFMDADIVVFPYFIERVNHFIQTHKPKFFSSWFSPDRETPIDALNALLGNMYFEGSTIIRRAFSPGPMTIVRQEIFQHVGGYDEESSYAEDYDLTQRIVATGVQLQFCRETLFILSFRRARKEGRLKFLLPLMKSTLLVLLGKKKFKNMPGYAMGGQLYTAKKKVKKSLLKTYETKLRSLIKEFLD